jgi:thioredoxin reductase
VALFGIGAGAAGLGAAVRAERRLLTAGLVGALGLTMMSLWGQGVSNVGRRPA